MTRRGFLRCGGGFRARHDWQIACTCTLYCIACRQLRDWSCKRRYMFTRIRFCPINTASGYFTWRWAYLFSTEIPNFAIIARSELWTKLNFSSNLRTSVLTSSISVLLVWLALGDNPKPHCASLTPPPLWQRGRSKMATSWPRSVLGPFKLLLNLFAAVVPLQTRHLYKES
jgi:hypothetical protein